MLDELTYAWNRAANQRAQDLIIPQDLLHSEWNSLSNLRFTAEGTLVLISCADGRTPRCEATVEEWRAAIQDSTPTHPYRLSQREEIAIDRAQEQFVKSHPLTPERMQEVVTYLEALGQVCQS